MMFYHLNNVHISLQILITCLPVVMSVSNDSALFVSKLLEGYDYRLSPNFGTGLPTKITIGIYVITLDSVDEKTMDYSMTIYFRQKWTDKRLSYTYNPFSNGTVSDETYFTLDQRLSKQIWTPDPFFYNEKKASYHPITKPNQLLRLYPNGDVFFSSRLSIEASCQMKLHKFPMDTQICGLSIESFSHSKKNLVMEWDEDSSIEVDKLMLPQFNLVRHYSTPDCERQYIGGLYTCLEVFFVLERDLSFYMIQTFVPTTLVVIVSWVSFWIGVDSVVGRISLGVLTILTMSEQTTSVAESSPNVSYIKAMDVWMSTCSAFVFGSLMEFAFVHFLFKKEIRRPIRKNSAAGSKIKDKDGKEDISSPSGLLYELVLYDPETQLQARTIDHYAKIGFPVTFLVFNIVFWTYYTQWDGK